MAAEPARPWIVLARKMRFHWNFCSQHSSSLGTIQAAVTTACPVTFACISTKGSAKEVNTAPDTKCSTAGFDMNQTGKRLHTSACCKPSHAQKLGTHKGSAQAGKCGNISYTEDVYTRVCLQSSFSKIIEYGPSVHTGHLDCSHITMQTHQMNTVHKVVCRVLTAQRPSVGGTEEPQSE